MSCFLSGSFTQHGIPEALSHGGFNGRLTPSTARLGCVGLCVPEAAAAAWGGLACKYDQGSGSPCETDAGVIAPYKVTQ